MKQTFLTLCAYCTLLANPLLAQDKGKEKMPYRFGRVAPADFSPKIYH